MAGGKLPKLSFYYLGGKLWVRNFAAGTGVANNILQGFYKGAVLVGSDLAMLHV